MDITWVTEYRTGTSAYCYAVGRDFEDRHGVVGKRSHIQKMEHTHIVELPDATLADLWEEYDAMFPSEDES